MTIMILLGYGNALILFRQHFDEVEYQYWNFRWTFEIYLHRTCHNRVKTGTECHRNVLVM